MRIASSVVFAAIALAGSMQASGAATTSAVQPGALLTRPDVEHGSAYHVHRCTMSFVFHDAAGALYTGTTGESDCTQAPGGAAFDENGARIGRVVFSDCAAGAGAVPVVQECGTSDVSFTLIRIDRTRYADVDPAMRGWSGPVGLATPGSVAPGDPVLFTGNAYVEGDVAATRPRAGVLLSMDARHFTADTLATLGDSGGPVVDATDGLAIGIISDFGQSDMPPTTDDGPTVAAIIADCAHHGIRLSLSTAPYSTIFGSASPSPSPTASPSSVRPAPRPSTSTVLGARRALAGTGLEDAPLTVAAMCAIALAASLARRTGRG
jgi:hypothetical protein